MERTHLPSCGLQNPRDFSVEDPARRPRSLSAAFHTKHEFLGINDPSWHFPWALLSQKCAAVLQNSHFGETWAHQHLQLSGLSPGALSCEPRQDLKASRGTLLHLSPSIFLPLPSESQTSTSQTQGIQSEASIPAICLCPQQPRGLKPFGSCIFSRGRRWGTASHRTAATPGNNPPQTRRQGPTALPLSAATRAGSADDHTPLGSSDQGVPGGCVSSAHRNVTLQEHGFPPREAACHALQRQEVLCKAPFPLAP